MNADNGLKRLFAVLCVLSVFCAPTQAIELITYYHHDALGSPVAASDEYGNELWTEHYRPYGERVVLDGKADDNTVWYTGKVHDQATRLSYFGARYYDPMLGRFMGVDPVDFREGNIQTFNRYAYANNNPYKYVDPDGRAAETAVDVLSLGLSIALFRSDPSFANGLGVVYDGLATAVPFLPAGFGIIKNAGNGVDALTDVTKGKGLQTPEKYFGNKTYKEAEEALTKKFGPPRGGGKNNKSFYNEDTKRTYNLHQDPTHRGGKAHIDIRKRDLPTDYYKDRPFFLKEGQ